MILKKIYLERSILHPFHLQTDGKGKGDGELRYGRLLQDTVNWLFLEVTLLWLKVIDISSGDLLWEKFGEEERGGEKMEARSIKQKLEV